MSDEARRELLSDEQARDMAHAEHERVRAMLRDRVVGSLVRLPIGGVENFLPSRTVVWIQDDSQGGSRILTSEPAEWHSVALKPADVAMIVANSLRHDRLVQAMPVAATMQRAGHV